MLMVMIMLPFFFAAMYRKYGFPAEKYAYLMIRQKFLVPGIRRYRTENLLKKIEEREQIVNEINMLEKKRKRHKERRLKGQN